MYLFFCCNTCNYYLLVLFMINICMTWSINDGIGSFLNYHGDQSAGKYLHNHLLKARPVLSFHSWCHEKQQFWYSGVLVWHKLFKYIQTISFLPQCHGHVLPQNSITCASLLLNHEGNKFLMYVVFCFKSFFQKKVWRLGFPTFN